MGYCLLKQSISRLDLKRPRERGNIACFILNLTIRLLRELDSLDKRLSQLPPCPIIHYFAILRQRKIKTRVLIGQPDLFSTI